MVKKAAHPEFRLFEYLNKSIDENGAQVVEAHLSACDDCASVARLINAIKETAAEQHLERKPQAASHPDLSELASFFYTRPRRASSSTVATHVALCGSCGEAIAQYARAERAAAEYNPASAEAGVVPAKAWEMIRDWEDSSFAKVKPANEVLGQELLTRLAGILNAPEERKIERDARTPLSAERVPVLIVNSSGEFRSIEFFDKETDSTGASVLRHSEGSARFDNQAMLALFGVGESDSFVVSNPIRRDTIRLERPRSDEESLRTDYIIIED